MEWVNAVVQGILLGGLYAMFAAGLSLIKRSIDAVYEYREGPLMY